MAVNTSVYGAADTWANAYYQQSQLTDKNKIANFGNNTYTLADGVTKGKLSYSEGIDKSLSFCGLGTECALSHIGFIARTSNNTAAIISTNDRFQTNFGFFELISNNLRVPGDFRTNELYNFVWSNNDNFSNYNKRLRPLTKVNPHNFIFVIRVIAYKSNYSEYVDVDLKTYLSTHKTNYPKIICAYVRPYFGNADIGRATEAGQGSPEYRIPLQIGLLDEFNFEGKNLKFYSYQATSGAPIVFGSFLSRSYIYNIAESFNMIAYTEACENYINIDYQNDLYYTSITYFDGIEDEILKTVACFGVYFTPNETIANRGALTNNDMYIGLLDENGIGHGEYLRGSETANAPQNNYTDMSQSGYDYTKEVDKTKYTNDTHFYTTWASSAFTKMYVLRGSDVSSLANELYTAVAAAPSGEEIERYNQSVFLTQNPIDCIISLKKFPIEFFNTTWTPTTPIKLGSYTCNTNGAPLPYTTGVYNFTFSNSSNNGLYPWFDKSFLDYEPYTKCELTIPFCGTVEIPTTYLYDYDTIDVKLVVDFITGACTAYIQTRNITIDSVSGECAVSLPVNGIQSATLDSQIHSAAVARDKSALTNGLGLIGGLAAVGIGIATGGIGTAVIGGIAALTSGANMITQDKNIEYELQHMQVPMKQVSGASGAINQSYDMRCKMRITRPKISDSYDAEVYANTVGFACLINATVDTLSGLTVGDINLDGLEASDVEKQLIKNTFASGVIL